MLLTTFYSRANFILSLLAADLLACSRAEKRPRWLLRLLLGYLPAFLVTYFWDDLISLIPPAGFFITIALTASRYLVGFLLSIPAVKLAYNADAWGALFYALMGYSLEHVAHEGRTLLVTLLSVQLSTMWDFISLTLMCAAVYAVFWVTCVRRQEKNTPIVVEQKYILLIAGPALMLEVFVSLFGIVFSSSAGENAASLRMIINIYSIISSMFFIFLEISLLAIKRGQIELAILRKIIGSAQEQYENSRDNINIINIKCHDLKHQLTALRGQVEESELDRIAHAVNIYDAAFQTDVEALSVILTEKSLLCQEKGIRLTCMVRGDTFAGWSESDVYVLFGNAIDNAIEGVEGLEEEKRTISIREEHRGSICSIQFENYYQGTIELEDGLPVTHKDPDYHGFGMKSIRLLAEKYGGEMRVSLNKDIYRLTLVLFQPEQT